MLHLKMLLLNVIIKTIGVIKLKVGSLLGVFWKHLMSASFGILMGISGTIITVIGFFIAYKVATYKKKDDNELDENNPVAEFWKDYPSNKK